MGSDGSRTGGATRPSAAGFDSECSRASDHKPHPVCDCIQKLALGLAPAHLTPQTNRGSNQRTQGAKA